MSRKRLGKSFPPFLARPFLRWSGRRQGLPEPAQVGRERRCRQQWGLVLAVLMTFWLMYKIFPPARAAGTAPDQGVEFVLLYGNDVRGETDPCG